ncbi:asparagine synthase-related protein [Saccharopolyspora shandongensis]|uniref:asparagine synthase-related protein n=1 Tax=Saccharopolyspora shandongensis TaxID=418495 RepID=UPI0034333B3E
MATTPPPVIDRDRYAWLHQAQEAGRIATHLARETAVAGLLAHSPFCDDLVIMTCLSVALEQARTPWSYKPLLAEAMRGVLPGQIRLRTTKDHSGVEWYVGLKARQPDLGAWAEGSRLVAAGVADLEALRRALISPGLLRGGSAEFEATLGIETWLRDLEFGEFAPAGAGPGGGDDQCGVPGAD